MSEEIIYQILHNYDLYNKQFSILKSENISDYLYGLNEEGDSSNISMSALLTTIKACCDSLLAENKLQMYKIISAVMMGKTKPQVREYCHIGYSTLNKSVNNFVITVKNCL